MRSTLLYNLFPKNHWKELTLDLLGNVPHDSIFISVSLDRFDAIFKKKKIYIFLKKIPKVEQIHFIKNDKRVGEVAGFNVLRNQIKDLNFSIVTYLHSKGVTKPNNKNIRDWISLMKYFVIDRHIDCISTFKQGYVLYGVNLGVYKEGSERYGPYKFSDFHYSGNFVSVNLNLLRDKFINMPCDNDYFGVEGFWGKLCAVEKAYNAHNSALHISNHYRERYPPNLYK